MFAASASCPADNAGRSNNASNIAARAGSPNRAAAAAISASSIVIFLDIRRPNSFVVSISIEVCATTRPRALGWTPFRRSQQNGENLDSFNYLSRSYLSPNTLFARNQTRFVLELA